MQHKLLCALVGVVRTRNSAAQIFAPLLCLFASRTCVISEASTVALSMCWHTRAREAINRLFSFRAMLSLISGAMTVYSQTPPLSLFVMRLIVESDKHSHRRTLLYAVVSYCLSLEKAAAPAHTQQRSVAALPEKKLN